jgi:hypothetical protein
MISVQANRNPVNQASQTKSKDRQMASQTQATYIGHPDHMSNVINSQCAWERKCLAKARETNWVAEFGPEPSEAVVKAAFANSTEAWAVLEAWKEQAAAQAVIASR